MNNLTQTLKQSIKYERLKREYSEASKHLTELQRIEVEIRVSELTGHHPITRMGKCFDTKFFSYDKLGFESLAVLREKYYLVRGSGHNGVMGYTIVFNTELKGVHDRFPGI